MKKIAITLFAAMLCISASAQLRTSRTFYKKEGRAIEWMIRAGLSFNNMAGLDTDYFNDDYESISLGAKTGFAIDFGFNKYFGQSDGYWGMELGIGTRGLSSTYKRIYNDVDEETEKGSMIAYTVKFSPFTIGYKIPVADNLKIDPHFGIYASYDLSREYDDYSEFEYDEYEDDYSADLGVQLGVGAWYGHFNIDFMYQRGFLDAVDMRRVDGIGKTSNFLIRVGYAF